MVNLARNRVVNISITYTVPTVVFIIRVSSIGYENYYSQLFSTDALHQSVNVGTIMLHLSGKQLSEVTVRASKPLMEQEPGGLMINVQNSLMTKGSTVLQTLSRLPGIIVDPQSSAISLNGKSGVMVMLDGKLLRLSSDQVAALLSGMTADDIDKIELLDTPPAKYDADGSAGLINIVTKKNRRRGTNVSVIASAGYGKGEKASTDIDLYHNTGKIILHASYSYAHDHNYNLLLAEGTSKEALIGNGIGNFSFNGSGDNVYDSHGVSFGLDYRPGKQTTIGGKVYYSLNANRYHNHNFGYYLLADTNLMFDSQLTGTAHTYYLHPNVYLEQYIGKHQKLNINLDYFNHRSVNPTQVQSNFSDSLFTAGQHNHADATIDVFVAQTDYINNLNKKLELETGLKSTYTHSKSIAAIENLIDGQYASIGAGTSNDLSTRELIAAGYAIVNWKPDSLTSLSAGTRYEYSSNTTDHSLNAQFLVDRKLGKLFPAIFLSRKLGNKQQIIVSYTERILRPSFSDLASYVSYNSPTSVSTGNPALKPTTTHNLKVSYNWQDYLFSILYSRDVNPIQGVQPMTGVVNGLVYLMPENADWKNNLTSQVIIPVKIADWWDMNYNFIGGWHQYHSSYFPNILQKSYLSYSVSFTESFKLPLLYSIELSGYYNSSSYDGNNFQYGNAVCNLGVKKELKNNHGSFQLSVADLFRAANYRARNGILVADAFDTNVQVSFRSETYFRPILKLSYSRSFGLKDKKSAHANNGTQDEQHRL